MKKSTLFYLFIITNIVNAQPSITWQKCLGGSNNDMLISSVQTTDGGYVLTGFTYSNDNDISGNHGGRDVWMVKVNSLGIIDWQKCLGGIGEEYGSSIQQTIDGGYIIIGSTKSNDGDVSGNNGGLDVWVVKLTGLGVIEWQKCLGGNSFEDGYSIQQTIDGGYILTGYTASNDADVFGNHGGYDAWVVKLTSFGIIEWQKCLGGSTNDAGNYIQQTADGGYILTGYTYSNDDDVSGNHSGGDAWVVKLTSLGIIQWQKCLGGLDPDVGVQIQQNLDGGYILAGYTHSNDGDVSGNHGGPSDIWVIKLTSLGVIEWQKCLGGSARESVSQIKQISDGGYVLSGFTYSNDNDVSGNHGGYDAWVVQINSLGVIQWQKCLGGSATDYGQSLQQTTDGGYILTGATQSNDGDVSGNHGGTGNDAWIVKLTSDLATNNFAINTITTYPNPMQNTLHVELEKEFTGTIFDITGKTLMTINTKDIDVSSLTAGFYLLDIISENKHYTKKLIKQ
jgi:hypothetical protein